MQGKAIFVWVFLVYSAFLNAQSVSLIDTSNHALIDSTQNSKSDIYLIGDIKVTGNKKTKEKIILREMLFKKGDYIFENELYSKLKRSKELIYNTTLFVDDSVYVAQKKGNVLFINVDVKERWYFFPLPYFILIDRNFNTWWVQENHDLNRINYGIKFMQSNFTGVNDKLNIWLINGYSQQITMRYDLPFLNKALTKGFNVGFTYSHQREVNYGTDITNKQMFFRSYNNYMRKFMRFDATYSYRPDQKIQQYFRISYINETVADTIIKLNPKFYPNQLNNVKFIDFGYYFKYYDIDYNAYPTKGFFGEAFIYKRGINDVNNLWQIGAHSIFAQHLLPKTYYNIELAATAKFPSNNYFYNQGLFGYGYYTLRGMEYYVVDGLSGALAKFTLAHQIFNYTYKTPFHSKTHDKIPFQFYLKAYSDFGYSYNPNVINNYFNNKLMRTWGVGLDVVSIYDFVFRFEYSFNQLGNRGLFFHARTEF